MVQVSSPPLTARVPLSLAETREEKIFWKNINDFLFRLWKRSGGGEDLNQVSSEGINDLNSKIMAAVSKLDNLTKKQSVVITTDSLTAKPFETIICKNTSSIDITLETSPKVKDIINIKRKDAVVNVIGQIDGKTNITINVQYYSMKLIYDGTEWSEV